MIELTDDYWIYGFWIAPVPESVGRQGDWMAVLYRDLRRDQTITKMRFRWYDERDPHKVWDSDDVRDWHTFCAESVADDVLQAMVSSTHETCARIFPPDTVDFIDLQCSGGDSKVIEKLNASPHFHLREATKEEFDQMRAPMN